MATNDKQQIQDYVQQRLLSRFEALNINALSKRGGIEEAAFLAGAASALQVVFETSGDKLTDYVPPLWIMWPLSGRSVVVELRIEKAKRDAA